MNNKGFALSSIIYGILIIFLLLIFSILSVMVVRGNTLYKVKQNAVDTIKNKPQEQIVMPAIIADFNRLNIVPGAESHGTFDYNCNVYSPYGYTIQNTISNGRITYSAYDGSTLITTATRNISTDATAKEDTFTYKGEYEKILLKPGMYKFEAFSKAHKTYTSGYLILEEKKIIYIYVGNTKSGFNKGAVHVSYKEGLLSNLTNDDILIAASQTSVSDNLSEASSLTEQNISESSLKITSLIYFTNREF